MSEIKTPFLSINNLIVEYTSEGKIVHAVNDVSLSVERGKTLALVGETGAGKTTIAKSILKILPDRSARIVGGSIEFQGRDLLKLSEKDMLKIRGSKISMIFQDPMTSLNPIMRTGDQVAEVIMEHNKVSRNEAKKRAKEMLKLVGIQANRYNNYPHEFSGGMKQRVIIAMALACNPELLLADEPSTALDVTIQAQVLAMIKELRNKFNTAMILITHDLGVVANIADTVAVMYSGRIIEYGNLMDLYLNPVHPYTIGLFKAIPNLETDTERLENIKGFPTDPTNLPEGCHFAPRCPHAKAECRSSQMSWIEVGEKHYTNCMLWKEIAPEVQINE